MSWDSRIKLAKKVYDTYKKTKSTYDKVWAAKAIVSKAKSKKKDPEALRKILVGNPLVKEIAALKKLSRALAGISRKPLPVDHQIPKPSFSEVAKAMHSKNGEDMLMDFHFDAKKALETLATRAKENNRLVLFGRLVNESAEPTLKAIKTLIGILKVAVRLPGGNCLSALYVDLATDVMPLVSDICFSSKNIISNNKENTPAMFAKELKYQQKLIKTIDDILDDLRAESRQKK